MFQTMQVVHYADQTQDGKIACWIPTAGGGKNISYIKCNLTLLSKRKEKPTKYLCLF